MCILTQRKLHFQMEPKKKVYKSFTCDDVTVKGKRKCETEAAAWAVQKENHKAVNYAAATHSPKSVKNMHGLVTAVFDIYRPDFRIKTDLPKKVRSKLTFPSESEIKRLLTIVEGTPLEIPILLAAFGPMRRGEICALDSDHIVGNIIHVEFSLALDENDNWIKKRPKSFAMERGGWGSDGILKSVYRHALDDIKKTENEKINNRFSKLYDTKYDTKTKNP